MSSSCRNWWSQSGSNRRPPACKAGALPAELWPLWLVYFTPVLVTFFAHCSHFPLYTLLCSLECAPTGKKDPASTLHFPHSHTRPTTLVWIKAASVTRSAVYTEYMSTTAVMPTQSPANLVGLGRFELPTSPLSGVRSNQLSYRPKLTCLFFIILRCLRIFPSVTYTNV